MTITTRRIEANGLSFQIDESGEGPDVALCLHGFPESRFSWRHQLPHLCHYLVAFHLQAHKFHWVCMGSAYLQARTQ